MIEFKKVAKVFKQNTTEVHAVRDVSLNIEQGEVYGMIGFSGAGKSTLVRCINLLEVPTSGEVIVDGQSLMELSPKELRTARKKIGMIFQHFCLMPSRTVFENIAYPLKGSGLSKVEIKDKVQNLLQLVEIPEKEDFYPSQLSGGQKQRVAIARALATDPKILLCDEATSALDPQTTNAILSLLKGLNKKLGITIVMITHEMAVIKEVCHKVAVMENGNVAEMGEVFDIFANPQEAITQSFIRSTTNLQKVDQLMDEAILDLKENEVLMKLSYVERNTATPHISYVARHYGVDMNIIFADIELINESPIGGTVTVMSGEVEKITAALEYLKENNVRVEVLKDGRIIA